MARSSIFARSVTPSSSDLKPTSCYQRLSSFRPCERVAFRPVNWIRGIRHAHSWYQTRSFVVSDTLVDNFLRLFIYIQYVTQSTESRNTRFNTRFLTTLDRVWITCRFYQNMAEDHFPLRSTQAPPDRLLYAHIL